MQIHIDQQCHGYKSGHQLLGGSITLPRDDQDAVDRLSDISGPVRPGELFEPYLTSYPLPSGTSYVLARTWQDLAARRAGCVLTRSFFISMTDWALLDGIDAVLRSVVAVDRDNLNAEGFELEAGPHSLPLVPAVQTVELVEALFLEERQPVVVFDRPDAELIILRLLTALWPGMRRHFSTCAFALAPRNVSGHPFNLLFSSKESRSRFARWDGRRIDGSNDRAKSSRHRWSLATARRIFEDPEPSLSRLDNLGVLIEDESGDESRLRLALLWNDLVEQSKESPIAILGMLDILKSRHSQIDLASPDLSSLISKGISLAASSSSTAQLLEFLLALIGKTTSSRIPIHLALKLRKNLAAAVAGAPSIALSFLVTSATALCSSNSILFAGIGDGFGGSSIHDLESLSLERLSDESMLRLLATSRSFAAKVLTLISKSRSGEWNQKLVNALLFPDRGLRSKARRNIVPLLNNGTQAFVLSACLREADDRTIASTVRMLWKVTGFQDSAFDRPLRESVRGIAGLQNLRLAMLALPETNYTDRLLLSTLELTTDDLRWALGEGRLSRARRAQLISTLMHGSDKHKLYAIAQDTAIVESLIGLLGLLIKRGGAGNIAILLACSNVPVEKLLDSTAELLPNVEGEARSELVNSAVARALRSAPVTYDFIVQNLMANGSLTMTPEHLIANAVPPRADGSRLSNNLVLLNGSVHRIRISVLEQIDNLSNRLTNPHAHMLSNEGILAWASLISDAGNVNHLGQIRAASNVLSFALSCPERPVSPLVAVAFPIVYQELKEGRDAPSLLSFLFTDWDRCKTARKDLIRAFLRSTWPAEDLLRAVLPTGDVARFMRIITKENASGPFLHALEKSVQEFPRSEQSELKAAIENARDDARKPSENISN